MAKGKRSNNLRNENKLENNLNAVENVDKVENLETVENVETEELQGWKDVPISNDFMFQHIMQKKSLCKRLLELLLHKEIADIEYPQLEKTVKPKRESKSVRLDVYVTDTNGNRYDVEMQTEDFAGNELVKRTRYYQSMIDMNVLKKGQHYDALKESYVIFICTFEPFDKHLRVYTFKNICLEDGTLALNDGTTKIFLNTQGYGDEIDADVADFLALLKGQEPKREFAKEVKQEFERLLEDKDLEVDYMTYSERLYLEKKKGIWEGEARGEKRGVEKGREENKLETALGMLKDKMAVALIMKYTQLSLEKIQELAASNGVALS